MRFQLNNTNVDFYDSIKNCPFWNKKEFEAARIMEIEAGGGIEGLEKRKSELIEYIKSDIHKENPDILSNCIQNLTINYHSILQKVDLSSRSLGFLVKSIDGVKIDDYSDSNIDLFMKELSDKGLTNEMIADLIEQLKKNLIPK